jgi:uncharacterized membrane protein
MSEVNKKTRRVYTLEEIRYNPDKMIIGIIACIPLAGLVLMFVEKKDLFVRYHATQFAFLLLVYVLYAIPSIGLFLGGLANLLSTVLFIIGIFKTSQGERFDIPYISEYALKVMDMIG